MNQFKVFENKDFRRKTEKGSYGDDSRTMLLACVDDGDLWFTKSSLGDVWTTWSTKWPTEDGRTRVPSCANAEFRLNKEKQRLNFNLSFPCFLIIWFPEKVGICLCVLKTMWLHRICDRFQSLLILCLIQHMKLTRINIQKWILNYFFFLMS